MVALIREGDLQPSAIEIADRAGVSHRSIFRYFDDLDDLMRTSINHAFIDAASVGRIEELGTGTLDERIAAFTDARLTLYRHVDGAMQVARMKAPSIPAIDQTIGTIAKASRKQIPVSSHPRSGPGLPATPNCSSTPCWSPRVTTRSPSNAAARQLPGPTASRRRLLAVVAASNLTTRRAAARVSPPAGVVQRLEPQFSQTVDRGSIPRTRSFGHDLASVDVDRDVWTTARQPTARRSTTNTRVSFGPMTPPAPAAP